jgi:hypothetical protein
MSEHNSSRGSSGALFAGSMARARSLGALTASSALFSVAKDTRDPFPSVIRNQHPMKDDAFTGMTWKLIPKPQPLPVQAWPLWMSQRV